MATKIEDDSWTRGFCTALAEFHRLLLGGLGSTGVCEVARNAGITLSVAREAGTDLFDLLELKKAGVPERNRAVKKAEG
jgi:hypothetical protein